MKNKSIIRVWIDSKEQKFVQKSQSFFNGKNIRNDVKPLEVGDLRLLLSTKEFFTVERKRYDDFVASYITKHLPDQAIRMNQHCAPYYCVIVHGSMQDVYKASQYNKALKRVKPKTVEKMHQKMELIYKLPCFFVDNDVQYFHKVLELSDMIVKSQSNNVIIKSGVQIKEDLPLSLLMCAPDIGTNTAKLLLSEFGTPQNVFNASRDDLLNIKGVGDSTVAKIKDLKEAYENGKKV